MLEMMILSPLTRDTASVGISVDSKILSPSAKDIYIGNQYLA